jgi:hypothetical protein
VTKGSLVVARLTPSIPRVRWVGDALVFIEKNEIREWSKGAVRTIAMIADPFVPAYPRDDVYFSADASRFTISRYSLDGTLQHYLGTTATGEVTLLAQSDGARLLEWSPTGNVLLLRWLDMIEWRDLDIARSIRRAVPIGGTPGVVHQWAPDGKSLLLGTVSPTIPGGNAFDKFTAYGIGTATPTGATVTLPNVFGERKLSPDGKYFAGVSRTGPHTTRLDVYRCEASTARTAMSRRAWRRSMPPRIGWCGRQPARSRNSSPRATPASTSRRRSARSSAPTTTASSRSSSGSRSAGTACACSTPWRSRAATTTRARRW